MRRGRKAFPIVFQCCTQLARQTMRLTSSASRLINVTAVPKVFHSADRCRTLRGGFDKLATTKVTTQLFGSQTGEQTALFWQTGYLTAWADKGAVMVKQAW